MQLNMHRAHAAAAALQDKVALNPTVCMITEPCTAFGKVSQTPLNHIRVPNTTMPDRPRSAIFLPKQLPHVYLEQLSNCDCTVVLLDTKRGKVLLASIYLDYNDDVVQDWLVNLMSYIDAKKLPALLAFDSNAHSQLYGPDTNIRGKVFEEFIMSNNLLVENRGITPTYHAFRGGEAINSCIDVTLSKNLIPLSGWRVLEEEFNGSDHHTIMWSLPLELQDRPKIRPWAQANWDLFKSHVGNYEFHLPEDLTSRKVDALLKRWYKVVNEGLDKACPKREAKLSPVEKHWYGTEQKHLKNRVKRKYLAYKHDTCTKRRKAYVRAKRSYDQACRRGRRQTWRLFVETTPDATNMAVLFKIAQKRDRRTINTLKRADNSLTDPGTETIQMLTSTHFPAATAGVAPDVHDNTKRLTITEVEGAHPWIDEGLVRRAMKQFKPNKAPGPDGLKPIIFKYLPHNAIRIITLLFKACISLCHTPKLWRETKVIFLPKPGKDDYSIPKSYRPISLSNFLLKTLERLVVWKMDRDMEEYPIHGMQHGFTKGKCTESAISNTADYIEQFLYEGKHCLGLFLDISAAFDSISIDHIRNKLLEHGGTPDMVEWYYSYLGRRYLEVELHGERVRLTTGAGFPQGGVCSAKFWLIAFNEAIQIINSNGITGNGYADDCSALLGGDHPHNMIDQMQTVLDRLVTWGQMCGLHFNAQKTVAVMFTRTKRTFERLVRMDGQLIPYSSSVVYLGVTMDSELKWKPHVETKVKKAKGLLMKLASIVNSYWGPRPKLMRWAYMGIVRPMVSYGAMAWGHTTEVDEVVTPLRRLNRLAMNTMVKVPRSTPTRAMEIILDVMPLHLHILKEGLSSYLRIMQHRTMSWCGVYPNLTYSVSHLRFWEYYAQDFGLRLSWAELDDCAVFPPTLNFRLNAKSFVDMHGAQGQVDCNVYTDGSKINNKVGSGVYITRQNITIAQHKTRLPDTSTVFQAELQAIRDAANILAGIDDLTEVKIFVDSQAALRVFQQLIIKSKLALLTIQALNTVKHESLVLVWTKAHIGTEGNEKADELAKAATNLTDITHVPTPSCNTKDKLDQSIRTFWQQE